MKRLIFERDPNPRYWFTHPDCGRLFDMSLYLSDRHWPLPLCIDGNQYRRRKKVKR